MKSETNAFKLYFGGKTTPFVKNGAFYQNNYMKTQVLPLTLLWCIVTASTYSQSPKPNEHIYFENSLIHSTANSEDHEMLYEVAKAAEFNWILDNEGPFTMFAPVDKAFEDLTASGFQRLLKPANKKELAEVLSHHIVAGEFSASKILQELCRGEGRTTFTTILGEEITATMEGSDIVLADSLGNKARILKADYNQCNGVMHVIDTVFLPTKL